jgi:hypothetical protein
MGLSQQQLAEQVNRLANHGTVTGHEVGRWETHQRIPRPYWRQWLGAALSVPIDQLNRSAVVTAFRRAAGGSRVSNDARAGSGAVPPQTLAPRTLEEVLAMWDQLVGRRQVLSRAGPAVGAAMIAAAIPGGWQHTDDRAGPEVYALHASLTERYRQLDVMTGPHAVYTQALDHHRQLVSWLARAHNSTDVRHLATLAADSGDLMAWLLFDLEEPASAIAVYREAAEAASRFDDLSLNAYLVGRVSRTLSECGEHRKALGVARSAQQIAGTSALPLVQSWLAVTRAFVHACLGEPAECQRDLDMAAEFLATANTRGDPVPGYIAFYGQGASAEMDRAFAAGSR